jgi:hypothetical protein
MVRANCAASRVRASSPASFAVLTAVAVPRVWPARACLTSNLWKSGSVRSICRYARFLARAAGDDAMPEMQSAYANKPASGAACCFLRSARKSFVSSAETDRTKLHAPSRASRCSSFLLRTLGRLHADNFRRPLCLHSVLIGRFLSFDLPGTIGLPPKVGHAPVLMEALVPLPRAPTYPAA